MITMIKRQTRNGRGKEMKRTLMVFMLLTFAMIMIAGVAQAATAVAFSPVVGTVFVSAGVFGAAALLGLVGMALSANASRVYELGEINELPVKASTKIYEGAAVGDDGTGYVRGLVAGDMFRGFAEAQADNSSGDAGDINVRVNILGKIKLAITSLSIKDVGKNVYASDDGTFTLIGLTNTLIGTVYRYESSGVGLVAFDATPLKTGVTEISNTPLVGVAAQGINAASSTQRYPLGTIMRKSDGREYVYAKAGATLNTDMGAKSYNTQHVAYTTIAESADAGDTSVVIDVAGTDGDAGDGAIAANELAGGYVVIFPHSSNTFVRGIVGNTVVASTGGECTLTLDDPIPVALVGDSDHGEAMASPYLDVRSGTGATSSIVGIPTVAATVGQFLWLLKRGIGWVAPQAEVSVGTNNREVVFRHDGSIDEHDYSDSNVAKGQHAGYVVQNAAGAGQGAPFVMFDI